MILFLRNVGERNVKAEEYFVVLELHTRNRHMRMEHDVIMGAHMK